MAWDSAWQRLRRKADAVPGGRGKGARDWGERGAYFLGTHRPRRRAVFPHPFRFSVTSQSAVGEAVRRILSGRSKDFLTVPIVYGIHFPAMRNSWSNGSPARKVLGARRRRVGGLARYVFSVVGTSRCDVRAARSGATSSNASVARLFVPPATTRAGMAQRAIPTIPLNPCAARARRSGLGARAASSSWISPSPPSAGGEGWGAEGRFYWFPLLVLPTRSSRGEDGELDAALSGDGKVPGTRGQACPRHGIQRGGSSLGRTLIHRDCPRNTRRDAN